MPAAEPILLAELPKWAFAFALVMGRVGAMCAFLPGVGEAELPTTIRVGFAMALTALLLPVVQPTLPAVPDQVWRVVAMLAGDLAAGLLLGWLTRLTLLALAIAGQFMASVTGLANVLQSDPALGPQTAAPGRLFGLAAPVLILGSGLHALPITALAGSFRLFPPGDHIAAQDMTSAAIAAVARMFALALQLAAPFVLADIVWQVGLGLLARLVPQLQIYFAALPGQILGGVALLALSAGVIVGTWQSDVAAILAALPGGAVP